MCHVLLTDEEFMRNPLSRVFKGRRRGQKADSLTPDGLRVTEFPAPVATLLRLYGVGGSYAQIYARQPNVRTVIDDIAREGAELTLKMFEKDPRGDDLPSARLEIPDHPAMELLSEPTPGQSTYRFWFSLFADIGIYDLALLQKVRVGGGPPKALLRVPPANLLPVIDPITGVVLRWRAFDGTIVETKDLIVFWGYDPTINHGSISPMETLRRLLAEEQAAAMDREGRWQNSARKDGVIEQEVESKQMSDEAQESFLLDVEDALAGPGGSGRPLLLQPGMRYKDVQWSPKDMEYILGRKLNRLEVASAFHYPPAKVSASENGGEPGQDTLDFFYSSTLPPFLSRVERELEAQLLPEFDLTKSLRRSHYFAFNLDSKLRGSFEMRAAVMATTAGGPVVTVNEARSRLDLPPIPGGDLIFVPLNSVRAGGPQASTQSPIDTPAEGTNPAGTTPGGGTNPADVVMMGHEAKMLGEGATIEEVLKASDAAARRNEFAQLLVKMRPRYEQRYAVMLERTFGRMKNTVKGGKSLKRDRWDRELADDIVGVMYPTVSSVGHEAADRVDGDYDEERTLEFLKVRAKNAAVSVNDQTAESLEAEEPDLDTIFGEGRIDRLAREFTTFSISWAQLEMARQNGELEDDDR